MAFKGVFRQIFGLKPFQNPFSVTEVIKVTNKVGDIRGVVQVLVLRGLRHLVFPVGREVRCGTDPVFSNDHNRVCKGEESPGVP